MSITEKCLNGIIILCLSTLQTATKVPEHFNNKNDDGMNERTHFISEYGVLLAKNVDVKRKIIVCAMYT